jgi:hypothetical protein
VKPLSSLAIRFFSAVTILVELLPRVSVGSDWRMARSLSAGAVKSS